jgi:hypothetical protein
MKVLKFETMDIDDVFTSFNPELPFELMVTAFYVNQKNQDKEWTFFINLN